MSLQTLHCTTVKVFHRKYEDKKPVKYHESLRCFCSAAGGEPDRPSLRGGLLGETSHVICTRQTPIHPEALSSVRFCALQPRDRLHSLRVVNGEGRQTQVWPFYKSPLTISETALHRRDSGNVSDRGRVGAWSAIDTQRYSDRSCWKFIFAVRRCTLKACEVKWRYGGKAYVTSHVLLKTQVGLLYTY